MIFKIQEKKTFSVFLRFCSSDCSFWKKNVGKRRCGSALSSGSLLPVWGGRVLGKKKGSPGEQKQSQLCPPVWTSWRILGEHNGPRYPASSAAWRVVTTELLLVSFTCLYHPVPACAGAPATGQQPWDVRRGLTLTGAGTICSWLGRLLRVDCTGPTQREMSTFSHAWPPAAVCGGDKKLLPLEEAVYKGWLARGLSVAKGSCTLALQGGQETGSVPALTWQLRQAVFRAPCMLLWRAAGEKQNSPL